MANAVTRGGFKKERISAVSSTTIAEAVEFIAGRGAILGFAVRVTSALMTLVGHVDRDASQTIVKLSTVIRVELATEN